MASVTLSKVRKIYPGGAVAVEEASLEIADREFLVLVGPSGCGKSTTLRLVAGLEEPTSGDIFIGGKRVNDVHPKDRDIAMVFQNYALYPHMTVYNNMAFGLQMRRTPRAEIDRRVRTAAETLGISELLGRKPKALSGGERQRVAVGRAIVRNPQVFLFDEPLSNLDAKLRVQMRAEIARLHQRLDATMIYVTHDQVEAMTMGDRIVVMLDGRIQQVAPPLELYRRPANTFVASFVGSPAMNLIPGMVHAENGTMFFHATGGGLHVDIPPVMAAPLEKHLSQNVILGLRPEDLHPAETAVHGQTVSACVEVVEPMGAETNIFMQSEGLPLAARVKGSVVPSPGSSFVARLDMSAAHFFDAATQAAIR